MASVPEGLQAVEDRISAACALCNRDRASVELLAVSKTQPPEALRAAHAAGQRAFGENRVQEALEKIAALADLRRPDAPGGPIRWHLVGALQSNKTRAAAEAFDWVHSVDRPKLAERLAAQRPPDLGALQVCLQVNVDGEATKAGVAPREAAALAREVARLPNLRLRGLMSIPEPSADPAVQRRAHRALRELAARIAADEGLTLDTLSMGMSDDLEAAIAEGSTIVRVGSAIFGRRG